MRKVLQISIFLLSILGSSLSYSQDSIAVTDISEEKELKFQQYFFKALSDKSITNYQKAIENLEVCNDLIPNKTAVLFELSKNYAALKRNFQAKEYINKALEIDSENIWMLEHLVKIQSSENDYKEAIKTQLKLVKLNPKKRIDLVFLYLRDRDYKAAMSLMVALEKEGSLSKSLKNLKSSLEARKIKVPEKRLDETVASLVIKFENDVSSFETLQTLLARSEKEDKSIFNRYTKRGLELFPAQPFVYLQRGKSLNNQSQFKKAIEILETGLDFVFDNKKLTKEFYKVLANSHKGLNNNAKYQEFINKSKGIE